MLTCQVALGRFQLGFIRRRSKPFGRERLARPRYDGHGSSFVHDEKLFLITIIHDYFVSRRVV